MQDAIVLTGAELPDSGVIAGTYSNPSITVNEKGVVTGITSGPSPSPSGAAGEPLLNKARFETAGTFDFAWPDGVNVVEAELWGPGASGGGSIWVQLGGAGASGAYLKCLVWRPASGHSTIVVGKGGAPVPVNTLAPGNDGGETSIDGFRCYGAGGGLQAAASNTGGEGGTPGVASAPDYLRWCPGGMGGASAPIGPDGLNHDHPRGASAPGGGQGGCNGQGGMTPGGGGAPGNKDFPSGGGGDGQVILRW